MAARNLGELPALIVAGALMDRVRADGGRVDLRPCRGDHLGQAVPGLAHHTVPLSVAAIAILALVALVAPLASYIDALRTQRPDLTLTVVLPEIIVNHSWQQLLHNGTARRLRRARLRQPGVVITTIPRHLAT